MGLLGDFLTGGALSQLEAQVRLLTRQRDNARAALADRDRLHARAIDEARRGRDRDLAENPWYAAFGDIPADTLREIARARTCGDTTLRALLVTAMRNDDPLALYAVADYVMGSISRPEFVVVDGEKVRIDEPKPYAWWGRRRRLHRGIVDALFRGRNTRNTPGLSLADVCGMTPAQADALPGIGPKRLAELKKWLADLGLALRDPAA